MRNATFFAFAILFANALVVQVSGATIYHFTDLGDLPGGSDGSHAFGINSIGQVVGNGSATSIIAGIEQSIAHAFFWTSSSGMQNLGTGPGASSAARGINAAGQIVGNYDTFASNSTTQNGAHAVIWTASDGMHELGNLPGDDSSYARAINQSGQIAGDSRVFAQGSIDHAVLWSSSGEIQYLGTLPGGNGVSAAVALNDTGQVAGTASGASSSRAFRWTSQGGMQDLGGISGGTRFSAATSISNSGDVAGYGFVSNATHAFLWRSSTGVMQDLGDLPGGNNQSVARGINSSDEVVGQSTASAGAGIVNDHAFVWTAAAGMKDLNNMLDLSGAGWVLNIAEAINDAGQIVGVGHISTGSFHAFLLTPVPEPSDYVLCLSAALVVLIGCRRKRLTV